MEHERTPESADDQLNTGRPVSDKEPRSPRSRTSAPHQPWRKFAFTGPRTAASSLVLALLAGGLGFATMTQVRQHEKSGLQDLSQSELVSLLSNINDQSARLETELSDLRAQKARLGSGGDTVAVAEAQKRLDQLAILNGTAKVSGPGVTIRVSGGKDVTGPNVLDAIEELRDAGAESLDVGGHRVVADTWIGEQGGTVTVNGKPIADDFTITAIGDPHTMATAMAIPGGVTDTLTQAGAQVKVSEEKSLRITSVVPNK